MNKIQIATPISRLNINIGSPIANIWRYAEKRGWVISLGEGSPFFSTPSHITDEIINEIRNERIARYCPPQGFLELRNLICDKLSKKNKISNNPGQIIVTNGASEGVGLALFSIIRPGDEVIITSPGYCSHIEMIKLLCGKPIFMNLDSANNWAFDLEALNRAISRRTKCILLSNPSNPIGSIISKQTLEEIAYLAIKHNLYIISDEAYEDYIFDNNYHFSIGSIEEISEKVISCFSFSKSYSLAGWRVGYTSSSRYQCERMLKIHEDLSICAPTISQVAAIAALKGPQDCICRFREILSNNRDLMLRSTKNISFIEAEYIPAGAFYLFARIINPEYINRSTQLCRKLIDETGVVVIPGRGFGPTSNNYIRLSFSAEKQKIMQAFELLGEWQ